MYGDGVGVEKISRGWGGNGADFHYHVTLCSTQLAVILWTKITLTPFVSALYRLERDHIINTYTHRHGVSLIVCCGLTSIRFRHGRKRDQKYGKPYSVYFPFHFQYFLLPFPLIQLARQEFNGLKARWVWYLTYLREWPLRSLSIDTEITHLI